MTDFGNMAAATECAASISCDTALAILAAHATPQDATNDPAAALTIARLFLVPLITRLLGGDVADALPWLVPTLPLCC